LIHVYSTDTTTGDDVMIMLALQLLLLHTLLTVVEMIDVDFEFFQKRHRARYKIDLPFPALLNNKNNKDSK
jgi:hypothetical protein